MPSLIFICHSGYARYIDGPRKYVGLLVIVLLALASHAQAAIPAGMCRAPGGQDIPAIPRIERSDWVNVKLDVEPKAVGDGVRDDTAALQAALNRMGESPGSEKTVYLPPGRYRITRTLNITKRHGGMLIGHGAESVIVWNGPMHGRMLWSNGAARQTYDGMVWDGSDRAGVGIDHDSKNLYETRVLHENMEFRRFRTAGIRVGHNQKLASAEMLFSNLKFYRNRVGVLFQAWNDYNNFFDGCHFVSNDYGIHAEKGNVNVRNSRFENSRLSDLFLSTHSHSLRRVVSVNSHSFIRTTRGPISSDLIRVENSRIDGWKNPAGAIISELRGPLLIFDTAFTRPPGHAAPIRLDSPPYMNQIAVLANVSSQGTDDVVEPGMTGIVHRVASDRAVAPLIGLGQTFLRDSNDPVGRILDVKEDCGAAGNGRWDDTSSIQRCLDRAASGSEYTTVYFPSGRYRVSRPLQIGDGARFRVEGTGWHSQVVWSGQLPGSVLQIHNPDGAAVEHMTFGGPTGTVSLHQTGTRPGSIKYHNVFGYFDDERRNQVILLDRLPAGTVVQADHLDGRVVIRDSSQATILLGLLISVQLTVEGHSPQSGFLGVLGRASALEDYPLVVRDNQSLVATDWYNEQSRHVALLGGRENVQGQIILDHTQSANEDRMAVRIEGYNGLIAQFGGMFGRTADEESRAFTGTTSGNTDLLQVANMYWHKPPTVSADNIRHHLLGNTVHRFALGPFAIVDNWTDNRTDALIDSALDAFRLLGRHDLMLNYCIDSGP